jgi:hypothetical protein
MNSFRRPSRSDRRPNTRAPTTSPTRYTVAIAPTAVDDMCSVSALVKAPATELATVISRPSRTHATPSAMTILVWNGDHLSRSTLAGIRLRTTPGGALVVECMSTPRFLCYLPEASSNAARAHQRTR